MKIYRGFEEIKELEIEDGVGGGGRMRIVSGEGELKMVGEV